jgi:hypothetical protein
MAATSNSRNEVNSGKSALVIEGVIVLLLTGGAYAAFLAKEIGYARALGLPLDVITTREVGLALAAESMLLGAFSYSAKVNLIWVFSPRSDGMLAVSIRRFIAAALLIGLAAYPFVSTDVSVWWLIGFLLSLAFFFFIFPLISQKNVKGYTRKLEAQLALERASPGDIVSTSLEQLGRQAHLIFVILVTALVFAYGLGRKEAIEQTEFFTMEERPGWVVLKIYGEVVVSALVDTERASFDGSIELSKLPDNDHLRLRRIILGRLAPPQVEPILLNDAHE